MTTERRGGLRRALGGIRTRVLVGYLALAAFALVGSLLVIRQVLLVRLEDQIERDLTQEVEELRSMTVHGVNRATGQPLGEDVAALFDTFLETSVPAAEEAYFTVLAGDPYRYSAGAPENLLGLPELVAYWAGLDQATRRTVATAAGEARTLAVPVRTADGVAGTFVVAAFPQRSHDDLAATLRSIALTSGLVFLVAAAAAWTLAGRVTRPIQELTSTARRISGSDLSARIPVEGNDELAELGRTFNEMVERLDQGMRDQRQFLDSVAHELRTPLTIARGHLEVAALEPDDQSAASTLVVEELDRMGRYVNDLLVLARSGQPDFLQPAPIDVGELLLSLMQRAPSIAPRRWVLDEAPRPGMVAAVADGGRIEQAMLSLATNAVQHTSPGDEVGLGAATAGRHLRLWVRDTGPGVDPSQREQIFERSRRGEASRRARPDGTGIGLSIVRAIARAHGGDVTVGDATGGGATFTITIPTEPEEPAP